jgi:hypothetical protein
MRRFKPVYYLIALIIAATISSCSTEETALPMRYSFHLKAISQLPASQKVQTQEMMDWYSANMQSYDIKPQWDKTIQTIRNNNHVVELMIADDGALFFTKANGELNVYACRWQDQDPKNHEFIGNIAYYSFKKNNLTGSVYNKYGLVKTGIVTIPMPPKKVVFGVLLSPDFWTLISLPVIH